MLPSELLKLYYEPQKDAPDEAAVVGCAPDGGTQDVEAISAEMKKLQRKLMKSNKVLLAENRCCLVDFDGVTPSTVRRPVHVHVVDVASTIRVIGDRNSVGGKGSCFRWTRRTSYTARRAAQVDGEMVFLKICGVFSGLSIPLLWRGRL